MSVSELRSVLWSFKAPIKFAFAYGSGVFPQQGYKPTDNPQVDLIFGVTYAQHFHSLNIHQNWHHYSFLRRFGSRCISSVQRDFGAGVYFNPYVTVNGCTVKYGIVEVGDLEEDLIDWKTLYLAGRLHKPVHVLRDTSQLAQARSRNFYSAIRVALLLLPEKFNDVDLFTTVAGLSYLGDPRMVVGENPRKVQNIVNAQIERFRETYSPFIGNLPNVSWIGQNLAQDMDPERRGNMVRRLPKHLRASLYFQYRRKFGPSAELGDHQADDASPYGTEFDRQIAADTELPLELAKSVKSIVAWPSTSQSVKGILTAGPLKSWRYSAEKLRKSRG